MSRKKMCPNIDNLTSCWAAMDKRGSVCDKCNDNCELIPSKKERVVKVKGVVGIKNGEVIYVEHIATGTSAMMLKPDRILPCTITYKMPKEGK